MKNKTKVLISIFAMAIISIFISEYSSVAIGNGNGAPAGKTGSPADGGNCTSCHSGTATTVGGLITSTIPMSGYIPGQTYTITGTITTANKTKFGFEISPQNNSGALAGTIIVTNSTGTKLVGSGKYITHQMAGNSFPSGTATWSFDWTAPVAGSGALTFYGAFNSTNSSNTTSGDIITLSTLPVSENTTTGIAGVNTNSDQVSVYPNPVSDKLYISSDLKRSENMEVDIIDINGKLIKSTEKINNYIDFSDMAKGYYILKIKTTEGLVIKKVVKE